MIVRKDKEPMKRVWTRSKREKDAHKRAPVMNCLPDVPRGNREKRKGIQIGGSKGSVVSHRNFLLPLP